MVQKSVNRSLKCVTIPFNIFIVMIFFSLLLSFCSIFFSFQDWWNDLLHGNNFKDLDYSGKMVILLDILTMSSDVGDKVLVFSQSIPTLDLIELYLSRLPRSGKRGKFWKKGKDWYRCVQISLNSFKLTDTMFSLISLLNF